MLKAIKFYLLDDEDKQTSLEVESAYAIKKNKEKHYKCLTCNENDTNKKIECYMILSPKVYIMI